MQGQQNAGQPGIQGTGWNTRAAWNTRAGRNTRTGRNTGAGRNTGPGRNTRAELRAECSPGSELRTAASCDDGAEVHTPSEDRAEARRHCDRRQDIQLHALQPTVFTERQPERAHADPRHGQALRLQPVQQVVFEAREPQDSHANSYGPEAVPVHAL